MGARQINTYEVYCDYCLATLPYKQAMHDYQAKREAIDKDGWSAVTVYSDYGKDIKLICPSCYKKHTEEA